MISPRFPCFTLLFLYADLGVLSRKILKKGEKVSHMLISGKIGVKNKRLNPSRPSFQTSKLLSRNGDRRAFSECDLCLFLSSKRASRHSYISGNVSLSSSLSSRDFPGAYHQAFASARASISFAAVHLSEGLSCFLPQAKLKRAIIVNQDPARRTIKNLAAETLDHLATRPRPLAISDKLAADQNDFVVDRRIDRH